MGMSRSEAGRLGAKKSSNRAKLDKLKRINAYNLAPKICVCGKAISYQQHIGHNKYCSKECWIKNWKGRTPKRKERKCIACGAPVTGGWGVKYCGHKCSVAYKHRERMLEIERNGVIPLYKGGATCSKIVRSFLEYRDGWKCSICGLSEWRGHKIPLHADHIDGNSSNNRNDNFRWVCPNCDEQLPTWGSRNRGSGRHYRRQRYKEGKSS